MTQSAQLIQAIRRAGKRGMTYGELEALRISTCPWKRLQESGRKWLRQGEQLLQGKGRDGLVRFTVIKLART